MKYAQLIKVSVEGNHNIEYKMKEADDGTFTIERYLHTVFHLFALKDPCTCGTGLITGK